MLLLLLAACGTSPELSRQPDVEQAGNSTDDSTDANSTDSTSNDPGMTLTLVAEGMAAPLAMVQVDDGILVADQQGIIWRIDVAGEKEIALDLREEMVELSPSYDERGLLGMALHPEGSSLFLYYSAPLRAGAPEGWDHTSRISEFDISEGMINPGSERVVMEIDQPQSNHNGGQIMFGPDGHLYVPLGDGGGADDQGTGHPQDWYEELPGGNGQSMDTLLGTILRIDVDAEEGYSIPDDNPFAGEDGREEIFAYGLRNPFRISFDEELGIIAADVGQNAWEEIDIIVPGGNYGWNVREGNHCLEGEPCPTETPDGQELIYPVLEFRNTGGSAIIGGYVYRGSDIPQLSGKYIFGDWNREGSGVIFKADPEDWEMEELLRLDGYLLSFSRDDDGELFVLTSDNTGPTGDTGRLFRLGGV